MVRSDYHWRLRKALTSYPRLAEMQLVDYKVPSSTRGRHGGECVVVSRVIKTWKTVGVSENIIEVLAGVGR